MPDETVEYGRVREESRLDRTGKELVQVVVPIWIGDHGPFYERLTREEYRDSFTLRTRVEALKATIRSHPA